MIIGGCSGGDDQDQRYKRRALWLQRVSNGDDYGIYDADDDDDTPLHRIKQREVERWAMENERDSTFADMYLHPRKSRQMWR